MISTFLPFPLSIAHKKHPRSSIPSSLFQGPHDEPLPLWQRLATLAAETKTPASILKALDELRFVRVYSCVFTSPLSSSLLISCISGRLAIKRFSILLSSDATLTLTAIWSPPLWPSCQLHGKIKEVCGKETDQSIREKEIDLDREPNRPFPFAFPP